MDSAFREEQDCRPRHLRSTVRVVFFGFFSHDQLDEVVWCALFSGRVRAEFMTPRKKKTERAANEIRLAEKTGRTLAEWVDLVCTQGPRGRLARVDWLKREHVLGRFQAQLVADAAEESGVALGPVASDPASLVDAQYSGSRAGLRPIYASVLARALRLGPDVAVRPNRDFVALVRNRQFAAVQPAPTSEYIELGLALGEASRSRRLVPAICFAAGSRFTHVVSLETLRCVDSEVAGWLQEAYDLDS